MTGVKVRRSAFPSDTGWNTSISKTPRYTHIRRYPGYFQGVSLSLQADETIFVIVCELY